MGAATSQKVNKTLVAVSDDKDLRDRLADYPAGALYCLPQQPDRSTPLSFWGVEEKSNSDDS